MQTQDHINQPKVRTAPTTGEAPSSGMVFPEPGKEFTMFPEIWKNGGGGLEMVPARDLYPVSEVAYRLGITAPTVWALIAKGRLPSARLACRRLAPAAAPRAFLAPPPA